MRKITLLFFMIISLSIVGQDKLEVALDQYNNAGVWEDQRKTEYVYDSEGNSIEETEYYWNPTDATWTLSYMTTNTYNTNNKITQRLSKEWNGSTYVNTYKSDYTYNTDGKLSSLKEYDYETGTWVLDYTIVINYANGLLDFYAGSDGDENLDEEVEFNYEDGVIESIISYEVQEDGELGEDYKDEYSYNEEGFISTITSYEWEDAWVANGSVITKTYDALGNILVNTEADEDYSYIDSYTYDTSELMNDYMHPFVDTFGLGNVFDDYEHHISKLTGYSNDDNNRTIYQYTGDEDLASIDDYSLGKVEVYPNPSSDFISVSLVDQDIEKVEIYNVLGEKVITDNTKKVSIKNLVNGIYLLKGTTKEGQVFSKKIIKE